MASQRAQGRAAVKFKRVSHGLCAVTPVLPGEDSAAFEQLRANLFHEYQPATETERVLVEESSSVPSASSASAVSRLRPGPGTSLPCSTVPAPAARSPSSKPAAPSPPVCMLHETDPKKLVNFFRYERTTTRDFYRILQELQELQKRAAAPSGSLPLSPQAGPRRNPCRSPAAAASASATPPHDCPKMGLGLFCTPHATAHRLKPASVAA